MLKIHLIIILNLILIPLTFITVRAADQPLSVCATVPELGSLVREVGGEHVTVTVFAKGTEDPHFVEAKPSFIKALSRCDLYVQIGLDLEIGWVSVLLQNARNEQVLPGTRGYLDASTAIVPLDIPTTLVDRSMGDVHPLGNPHYLLDPLNGVRVAALIRDKLSELQPGSKPYFNGHYEAFRQQLGAALVGEMLAQKYDVVKLALLFEHGRLDAFLRSQGEETLLGGWLGMMRPYYGTQVVDDHNIWPYFARRFGITIIGHLEPKPGIPPTTAHLNDLVHQMKTEGVKAVLAASYYDPRYAGFVSTNTSAKVAYMANQAGARPGTEDYLQMVDYNVQQLAGALAGNNGKH